VDAESSKPDVDHLIAEIAKRHKIALGRNDAIFAAVTLNELVLERTVDRTMKAMQATLDKFDTSILKAENRAGEVLAQQVKDSVGALRQAIRADIGQATIDARELVRRVNEAHGQQSLRFWTGIALLCATLLCLAGFWLGRLTAP
jgi:hypothetical protein